MQILLVVGGTLKSPGVCTDNIGNRWSTLDTWSMSSLPWNSERGNFISLQGGCAIHLRRGVLLSSEWRMPSREDERLFFYCYDQAINKQLHINWAPILFLWLLNLPLMRCGWMTFVPCVLEFSRPLSSHSPFVGLPKIGYRTFVYHCHYF